jgi:hypothetical protein
LTHDGLFPDGPSAGEQGQEAVLREHLLDPEADTSGIRPRAMYLK